MNPQTTRAPRRLLRAELPENAVFKCIGLGGVGCLAVPPLAVFLAAQPRPARLALIDGDTFEPANASRMFFCQPGNKAAVVCEQLLPRFADSPLSLIAIEEYVTPDNISRLIREGDHVILAVDNHATRKLVSDHCATLRDVCLVSGGNDGVEPAAEGRLRRGSFGNAQIYVRRGGADLTPPLVFQHPEIAQPKDRHPADKSCTELVASVPQILFANLMVAACLLNTLWLHLCGATHYREVVFDLADGLMRPIPLTQKLEPEAGRAPAD